MKLLKIAAAAATGLALLGGTALADDKPVVGLIMKSLANEFFQNMMVGAEEHQKRRGDYELKAVGMQNEWICAARVLLHGVAPQSEIIETHD